MDLVTFLILFFTSESIAYRGNCGNGDYYQDRHHGIRRYYQRSDLSPDELYHHSESLGDDGLDDDINLINHGTDGFNEQPLIVLPKRSRWNRIKYSKLLGRYQPKNMQTLGYKVISKHSGKYGNLILLPPKTAHHYINKDDPIITVNGNEVNYSELASETDDYNSLNLEASNDDKELISRKNLYGSPIYRQTNLNIPEQSHQNGINSGIIASRIKNSYGARSKHSNYQTDENIAEVDNSNAHPTIIISTRSDTDIDFDDENDNTNTNTNANINNAASDSAILLSTRRNALNSGTEYGKVSDIIPNDNDLIQSSSNDAAIIVSTRRKEAENTNENQNININSNVNAENRSGISTILVGTKSSMPNIEKQLHDARRNNDGSKKTIAPNMNKNVNMNTNVNSNGESSPVVLIAARRNSLKSEASYDSRNDADNELTDMKRNNNNNVNVNTNVNSGNIESAPEIVVTERRNTLKGDTNYSSRRNNADDKSTGTRRNDNKNINVNTNVNSDGERNVDLLVAARRQALQAEASYGARSSERKSEVDGTGAIIHARAELNPIKFFGRRNSNENSNVNINVNAEDAKRSPSIIAVARRRLVSLNNNDKDLQTLTLSRQNIVRRSQLHAPKNENRNVNINVNRLESDEV